MGLKVDTLSGLLGMDMGGHIGDKVPSMSFFAIIDKEEEVPAIKPVDAGDVF